MNDGSVIDFRVGSSVAHGSLSVGSLPPPGTLQINCEKIHLVNNTVDIDIEIPPQKIDYFQRITINGVTFEKQQYAHWVDDTEYYDDEYSECNVRHVNKCSRCGRTFQDKPPRCNCGALMKLDEE